MEVSRKNFQKGRQYGDIISYWYYYLDLVAFRIYILQKSRCFYSYCAHHWNHSRNHLAIAGSVQAILALPFFKSVFALKQV